MKTLIILLLPLTIILSACQTKEPEAAMLLPANTGAEQSETLSKAISDMLNGATVRLAADAFVTASAINVERQSLQNQSPERSTGREYGQPDHFRLWLQNGECILEHVESGNKKVLEGFSCTAVE